MDRWLLVPCDCEDGFAPFCRECEAACDHDVLCPLCHGTGERPQKADAIDLLVGGEFYPTRRAAIAAAIG